MKNKFGLRRKEIEREPTDRERMYFYFSFLFFSLRYMEFRPSEFVGPRTKSALLDEGYV